MRRIRPLSSLIHASLRARLLGPLNQLCSGPADTRIYSDFCVIGQQILDGLQRVGFVLGGEDVRNDELVDYGGLPWPIVGLQNEGGEALQRVGNVVDGLPGEPGLQRQAKNVSAGHFDSPATR